MSAVIALDPVQRFVDVAVASRYSGISSQTLKRYVKEGRLAGCRPGPRKILIERASLDQMLEQSRVRP
jgi:excisionase family DNA binding protein